MNEAEIKEKLKTYAETLNSLYSEKIIRTYNSPIGDYAEWVVSQKMGLTLQKNSKAGYDAIDDTGLRYQIKSRWLHPGKNTRQLNVIRDYDKKPFDYLIAVIFGTNFDIEEAYLIPHEILAKYFPQNKHQNGIVVTLTHSFISDPQVKDIREKFM